MPSKDPTKQKPEAFQNSSQNDAVSIPNQNTSRKPHMPCFTFSQGETRRVFTNNPLHYFQIHMIFNMVFFYKWDFLKRPLESIPAGSAPLPIKQLHSKAGKVISGI